eukprot:7497382-Pyramimonas_sp.AAC.1
MTDISLEPRVDLHLPVHVGIARHLMDVRATEDHRRWLDRISSTQLKLKGVGNVAAQQESLLAERFASLLKGRDIKVVKQNLIGLFN